MEILQWLHRLNHVKDFFILLKREWEGGYYYKIKINLIDQSVLIAKEDNDEDERNYSYHWQNKDNQLITRWDNSPYHKDISTHPHHKHLPGRLAESNEMTLESVINEIEKLIKS